MKAYNSRLFLYFSLFYDISILSSPNHTIYIGCTDLMDHLLFFQLLYSLLHADLGNKSSGTVHYNHVPSRRIYSPDIYTIRAYVSSLCMYHPDLCTVRVYVPSRLMYCPDVCRLSGFNRLTKQESKFGCTGSPLLTSIWTSVRANTSAVQAGSHTTYTDTVRGTYGMVQLHTSGRYNIRRDFTKSERYKIGTVHDFSL